MTFKTLLRTAIAVCLPVLTMAAAAEAPRQAASRTWFGRVWEFAYFIKIDTPDKFGRLKRLSLKDIANKDFGYLYPEAVFPKTVAIQTNPNEIQTANRAIGALVIEFDPKGDGDVLTPHEWPQKLTAHITDIETIVIASGDGSEDVLFQLGKWQMANSYYESPFSPGICGSFDRRISYGTWRYQKNFAADRYDSDGNFGCREWGYYLYDPEIPYIDVTSYGKDKLGTYSYIRPTQGWRRFTDDPKPVIGKHGKVWVCLHDCPNGEVPGIIPNIRLWAARNGWPEPKRPKKLPMFPEPDYKPGELLD